jgi:putative membrane protein
MLWIKTLHIVLVASWFAGLFYLPRIFVNLAMIEEQASAERARLLLMARKLMRFMNILAVPALILGMALWLHFGIGRGEGDGWMRAKIFLVLITVLYHFSCIWILKKFENSQNKNSHLWFRWFNELPVLLMFLIAGLVVIKPFDLNEFFFTALTPLLGLSAIIGLVVVVKRNRNRNR